jgi:hypothetical protein
VSLLRTLLVAVGFAVLAAKAAAQDKPAVPPGRDPGGVAVALIATGIDYRLPGLARRLARDGEGELIGWDLEDNDRRPFDKGKGQGVDGTVVAGFLLGAEGVRLVPVRIHPTDPASLSRGLAFAARTPARAALLVTPGATPETWAALRQAAPRLKHLLLILAAGGGAAAAADVLALDNVAGVEEASDGVDAVGFGGGSARLAGAPLAVAAAGLAAAALLEREPRLDAAALKRRLVDAGGGKLWRARP